MAKSIKDQNDTGYQVSKTKKNRYSVSVDDGQDVIYVDENNVNLVDDEEVIFAEQIKKKQGRYQVY